MKLLFWVSAFGALYSYFLYPLLLASLPTRRRVSFAAHSELPDVSVIITAHNEASRIREKLENMLAVDYPLAKREILVASDASTDGTDTIVLGYLDRGVRLIRAAQRLGKENAQKLAIAEARGDIIVFSDVATRLDVDGLQRIVTPFTDPRVGAVSSEDRFLREDGTPAGEGAYVRYEMWLRRLEASRAGLVGLSADWDKASPSDFNTAFNCARLGYVAVVAPDAIGYYRDIQDGGEYRRKYRTVLRGMASLWRHWRVLNPFRYGLFAWQIWSHKLMRWMVPWFLPVLLVTSASLGYGVYLFAFALQLGFYGLVVAGQFSTRMRRLAPVRIAYFFMEVNTAIAHAALAFAFGNRITVWEPSKR
jgi:glycosyltransferase involved in cell wall biosynthesis